MCARFLSISFGLILFLFVAQAKNVKKFNTNISDSILGLINENAKPCEDFYDFACGKWNEKNPIPSDLKNFNIFNKLELKAQEELKEIFSKDIENSTSEAIIKFRQYYKACMNVEAINARRSGPLIEKLEKLGYWPIIHGVRQNEKGKNTSNTIATNNGLWSEKSYNLTALLAGVTSISDVPIFFNNIIFTNFKNASQYIINIDQSELALKEDYYLESKKYAKEINAYKEKMHAKVALVAKDANISISDKQIVDGVNRIFDFEVELAGIIDPDKDPHYYPLSKMSDLFKEIDWNIYYRLLMPKDMLFYLDSDPTINVLEVEYMKKVSSLLERTEKRTIVDYVLWRYVDEMNELDERYNDINQKFNNKLDGRTSKQQRWKICGRISYLNHLTGALYVRKYFPIENRNAANEITENILKQFIITLKENDWMDPATKQSAIEKAKNMLILIGAPDFMYNNTALDNYYKNLTLDSKDKYFEMIENIVVWTEHSTYRLLSKPVDRKNFAGFNPSVVNSYNVYTSNKIIFPAAIIQSPLFDPSFPKVVNYARMGSLIGHEITHGFDDIGVRFDKWGNKHNWRHKLTEKEYKKRIQCYVDEYSAFRVPGTNLTVNGTMTQDENVAENTGIKEAYLAYQSLVRQTGLIEKLPGFEKYSNEQIFFIAFSQNFCDNMRPEMVENYVKNGIHSLPQFRVNGVMKNQPEFAKAFKCSPGSPMNPEKKCTLW